MMVNHIEKAKELLEQLKLINEGDLKEKEKLEKKLNKISNSPEANNITTMMQNSEIIVKASGFVRNNGKHTFDSEIMSVGSSDVMKIFLKYQDSFKDREYWKQLSYVYSMQDYKMIDYELYKALFNSSRPEKEFIMNTEERLFFEQLPDKITIYRGGSKNEIDEGFGISWTLNKTIAEMFVTRKSYLADEMMVHKLVVDKSKVIAYFNERKEEEIIYLG